MGEIKNISFGNMETTQRKFTPYRSCGINSTISILIQSGRGWVEKAHHYLYSSASNYVTGKGLLEIELADQPIVDTTKTSEFWKYNNYEE